MTQIEERVSDLEKAMRNLIYVQHKTQLSIYELSEEMREFKDEMREFKDEMRQITRELNIKWGELANRLGTIVEDLVAPNLPLTINKSFNLGEPDDILVRFKRHVKATGLRKEVDLLIVFHEPKIVFLNETKSQATDEYITQFHNFIKSGQFQEIFPEYADYLVVPVFSSIMLEKNHIKHLTDKEIFGVQIEGDILTFKNLDEVKPFYFKE